MHELTWDAIHERAQRIALNIDKTMREPIVNIYGIPRGGVHAAQAVLYLMSFDHTINKIATLVDYIEEADVIVDDIIDSGRTRSEAMSRRNPGVPFWALVDKLGHDKERLGDKWIVFPWERGEHGPEDAVRRLLQFIGEDPDRDGLQETPRRVLKSFEEIYGGYKQDPSEVLKTFEFSCDEMVLVKDIEFFSTCEHHMLPFFGKAHIAYIPSSARQRKKVVGVSKIIRLLEVFSRRLQIQERLTDQITSELMKRLQPLGAACVLEATHFCMTCRGVGKQSSKMVTSSLKGVFLDTESQARAEFLSMIQ